jgi:2-polyprenyl-3-methyl-5-hydroxy-6-metoxy-1,4-benzoquinol methylase
MSEVFDRAAGWSTLTYSKESLILLPWHNDDLDEDLSLALDVRNVKSGKFLDIGTGHGTQANQLQLKGFDVVGTDINSCFLEHARQLNPHVDFRLDNIVITALTEQFDYVFDRGCFHWLQRRFRQQYVKNLHQLVNGLFFLKVIDKRNTTKLPGASNEEVLTLFEKLFNIESIHTGYFNSKDDKIRSIFFVMKPK